MPGEMSSGKNSNDQEQQIAVLFINNMTFSGGSNPQDENDCVLLMTMIDNQRQPIATMPVAKFKDRQSMEAFVEWMQGATAMVGELQAKLELRAQLILPGQGNFKRPN